MAASRDLPRVIVLAASALLGLSSVACTPTPETESWLPGPGLKTRWAQAVDPASPHPEYPRPQVVRPLWHSLNGLWDLAVVPDSEGMPASYPQRILVPYPVESALSGVMGTVTPEDRVWYRRIFSRGDLPEAVNPEGEVRWLLHFGAVDWEAEVFLNGQSLGTHRGGYDPFSFDITESLAPQDEQELVVAVRDPTSQGTQPRGKQVLDPHGIWYTAVTGIWQTVWIEPVHPVHVVSIRMDPDLRAGTLTLTVAADGAAVSPEIQAVVLEGGIEVTRASGAAGEPMTLALPGAHPWSPSDPFLYDLRVEVAGGDVVESYFGMRSISLGTDEKGHTRLFLNGLPLFQYGLLDQGWWPDGLYTAPTDEALRFDIEKSRELGFNLIRKHVKVEPARWYHHADREGILVWQDMPSGGFEGEEAQAQYARELAGMVESLRNHPSIVMWVPFNEGWGQHATEQVVEWLQETDPTRLVNNASGWTDEGVGDVMDIHRYPGPGAPDPAFLQGRAPVLGEFGGLGLPLPGHTWVDEENWGYRSFETMEDLNQAYGELLFQLRPLIAEGLSAAVYTQTTDVEVEVNGIMTYDREVVKLSDSFVALHDGLYGTQPELKEVVATSSTAPQSWKFTTDTPPDGWEEAGFDDSAWAEGPGPFGNRPHPGAGVGTPWQTSDLWIRRSFRLGSEEIGALGAGNAFLRVEHDEDAEIYLNGIPAASLEGYITGYRLFPLTDEARLALKEGTNTLAVHVHQTDGGQFIDVGIAVWPQGM